LKKDHGLLHLILELLRTDDFRFRYRPAIARLEDRHQQERQKNAQESMCFHDAEILMSE
jgi:hypothetical protein